MEKPLSRIWLPWVLPWLAPLIATGLSVALSPVLPRANFAMIYLAGVVLTAVTTRVKPALVCAGLSFLAYNFFHTEPHFTLIMIHREDILTVILLVLVAGVSGHLAARLHEKVVALEISDRWSRHQIKLAQDLARCVDGREVVAILAKQVSQCFSMAAEGFYRASPQQQMLSLTDTTSSLEDRGSLPANFPGGTGVYLDRLAGQIHFVVENQAVGAVLLNPSRALTDWQKSALDGFVSLARLAWSRIRLSETLRQETVEKEREQLRSALLSSISHDLRTPLSTMIGSVSSLIDIRDSLGPEQQEELLRNTLSEARRLDRYIQKLLDMTRLGHGELTLDRDWVGLDDILTVVIRRGRSLRRDLTIDVDVPADLPLLHVHPALIEQAVFNVLENAIRYAPPDSTISLAARVEGQELCIDIHDCGPGIPVDAWETVFDMFYTFGHGDQFPSGTGLGLAICQGILGAHGGRAKVLESSADKGTTFRLTLPLVDTDSRMDQPS